MPPTFPSTSRPLLLAVVTLWMSLWKDVQAQNVEVSNATAVEPFNGCYSDLRSLNAAMLEKNAYEEETFILCPNTVFNVGFDLGVQIGFRGGDEPLRPRSNSIIKCGESGSSQNNCTIRGGDAQFQMFIPHHPEPERENVVVQGITFASVASTRVAVVIVAPGYIQFLDCVFKPTAERDILEVTFEACLFENNTLFRDGSILSNALIGGGSSVTTLVLRNSVFAGNNLVDDLFARSDVVEMQSGGDIKLENNCFIDNHVTGDGVVRLLDEGKCLASRGNFGTRLEGASCDFLVMEEEGSCKQYDFPQCALNYSKGQLIPPEPGFSPQPSTTVPIEASSELISSSSTRWGATMGIVLATATTLWSAS